MLFQADINKVVQQRDRRGFGVLDCDQGSVDCLVGVGAIAGNRILRRVRAETIRISDAFDAGIVEIAALDRKRFGIQRRQRL